MKGAAIVALVSVVIAIIAWIRVYFLIFASDVRAMSVSPPAATPQPPTSQERPTVISRPRAAPSRAPAPPG